MASVQRFAFLALAAQVRGQGSPSGGSSASGGGNHGTPSGEQQHMGPAAYDLANNLLQALAAFVFLVFVYRVISYSVQYIRHLTALNNNTQRYFAVPNSTWATVKNSIIYAPLFRKRHNHEFKLSAAINMGTLPTRFQTLFMIVIIATNTILCVYSIPWSGPQDAVLAALLARSGTLATANLIPLVIMAGRNNPLISWLNISFDTFNMMHRLFARILTLEAICHTLCWVIKRVNKSKF